MAEMVARKGDPYILLGIAIHVHTTPLTMGTKQLEQAVNRIPKEVPVVGQVMDCVGTSPT